jgi:hypothetical protein
MWTGGAVLTVAADAPMLAIDQRMATALVVLLGAIVLLLPNTQQILHRF